MRVLDQAWIGRALFVSGPAKGKARDVLTTNLANWWHPPRLVHTAKPTLAAYFARRLFLWMPRKMWHMRVTCSNCGTDGELRSKGLYRRVRRVIDVTDVYYLAAEYMDCRSCKGTFVAWDLRILDQLPEGIRARFPVVLTYMYACDRAVIATLRTLGNSPTAMRNSLQEAHSEAYLRRVTQYLHDCVLFKAGHDTYGSSSVAVEFQPPPQPELFHSARWFLTTYVQAAVTSTFARVLKIDSTKKVCREPASAWRRGR